VTAEVAESLQRSWVCCELDEAYLKGAMARLAGARPRLPKAENTPYQIFPPCSLNGSADNSPLTEDGGFQRAAKVPPPRALPLI